ncbi:MAG: tail fiber domain-containing protein [Chitinophagales bacterium]|nr:tail fiber domain-containing protein [Chitinophagales bacterium]
MKNLQRLTVVFLLMIRITVITNYSNAQNTFPSTGSVGIGTTTPNTSSLLDMISTTKGMLAPRMTKAQRDAISTPATGLLIYQTNSTPGFYYYDGTKWLAVTSKSKGWLLTGNSAIDPAINFIGTTDLQPLKFRVNNITAGELNPVNGNTAFGMNTLLLNTTGYSNVAIGTNALHSNVIRHNIVAIGDSALFNNDNGAPLFFYATANTAIGSKALYSNTSGYDNTATGFQALYSNTTGQSNTGNGYQSLYSNTTGGHNTANGISALYSNTTAGDNTATGYKALYFNVTGISNTANGSLALEFNTGNYNTATGSNALMSNTTGNNNTANGYNALSYNTTGHDNTANGYHSLYLNTSGNFNTAFGESALYSNTTASDNTATGYSALAYSTGYGNTATGNFALASNTTGSYNTAIGLQADVSTPGSIGNSTAIGYFSYVSASNQVRIGNTNVTSIGGQVDWTFTSDSRVKKNIKANVPGLTFINKLQPVTFNFDLNAMDKIVQRPAIKMSNGKIRETTPQEIVSRKEKEQIVYTGFIAQDVEKAAKELNYDFSGVDAAKNDKDLYGLRYAEFVVPLVKAVQELSAKNDEKDIKMSDLQIQIDELKVQVQSLLKGNIEHVSQNAITLSSASLEQNTPNPFNESTEIQYALPSKFFSAQIIISDQAGKIVRQNNISTQGKGVLKLDAGSLSAGTYNYSLIVDGTTIDTKKMVILKY